MNICEHCGYHLKMNSSDRIKLSIDPGTWNPVDEDTVSMDPIEFHSEEESEFYKNRMDSYQRKTGLTEAIQTGTGQLNEILVAIGIMDFQFMWGSMGSVVGEKITRLVEHAGNQLLPLILVYASEGARMQEDLKEFRQTYTIKIKRECLRTTKYGWKIIFKIISKENIKQELQEKP